MYRFHFPHPVVFVTNLWIHVLYLYIYILLLLCYSSGVIWETCKSNKQRFKPLSVKECLAVEEAFVRYNMELAVEKPVNSRIIIDTKIEVNIYIH